MWNKIFTQLISSLQLQQNTIWTQSVFFICSLCSVVILL